MSEQQTTDKALELEAIQGCNVTYKIDEDSTDGFIAKFLAPKGPAPQHYFEIIDKKGNVLYVVENRDMAYSVAGRMGLNFRQVNYNVSYDVIKKEEK